MTEKSSMQKIGEMEMLAAKSWFHTHSNAVRRELGLPNREVQAFADLGRALRPVIQQQIQVIKQVCNWVSKNEALMQFALREAESRNDIESADAMRAMIAKRKARA